MSSPWLHDNQIPEMQMERSQRLHDYLIGLVLVIVAFCILNGVRVF